MTQSKRPSRVFTVAPGKPFLDALSSAILAGDLPSHGSAPPDTLALPDITLYMPTARATRALQSAFLKASKARALLMPRIRPIAEGDDDLTFLTAAAGLSSSTPADLDLPASISALERTLTLTKLVMRWSDAMRTAGGDDPDASLKPFAAAGSSTPGQAASLAAELGRLMDTVETEGVPLTRLADLVPDAFSEHWRKTLDFLDIITSVWPQHLRERGVISATERRNRLIAAEAARLRSAPPSAPVIVAGVTGSIPATVELMKAVIALPNGAIVLPGLDLDIDDETWNAIRPPDKSTPGHPEHPQFGLKTLLDALGVDRRDVHPLAGSAPSPRLKARNALVSQAMRPSTTTSAWHHWAATAETETIKNALTGVSLIEVPSAQDEAEAVALILRHAADTPGLTAALVSPDRLLARRVAIRLEAWGIRVDDSAGRPFAKTVPGTFLDLVLAAAVSDFAPADVMSLLRHPLMRAGVEPFVVRRSARALEIAAFRTHYLGRGLAGIEMALVQAQVEVADEERRGRAVRRLRPDDWNEAAELVKRLGQCFAPLSNAGTRNKRLPLADLAKAHTAAAEALAVTAEIENTGPSTNPLWQTEAGDAAKNLFIGLMDRAIPAPDVTLAEYRDLYASLIARENVRQRTAVHPRLSIWGPFEARVQQPDIVILGSLNDGTWPEVAEPGAWLNRPMRRALGLPQPEEAIGYAAHDFTTLLGAERVYLTRAEKIKGVPTVPSRWLMRLNALLDGANSAHLLKSNADWASWALARNAVPEGAHAPIRAPEPKPPVALRPRRMSVTRIESWLKNPYAVYASSILHLDPLPPLGEPPGPSLRGALVHDILSTFADKFPEALPPDPLTDLRKIAAGVLKRSSSDPRVAAFWLPRIDRFLIWFTETEHARRTGVIHTYAEVGGTLPIDTPGGVFTLSARADRIDRSAGGLLITDYKTGRPPVDKAVVSGAAPQLPLEAAIAIGKPGFEHLSGAKVTALRFIRASGAQPPGDEHVVKTGDVGDLASDHLEKLRRLITRFDDPETAYKAIRRSRFSYDYDDYAHLARVAEWSAHAAEED